MPDSPNDLVPRVAVLEQIAKDTREALSRIERRFDAVDVRLDKLGAELRGEIGAARAETAKLGVDLRADTAKLGVDLRADTAKLGAELRADTAKLGTELRGEIGGVRGEINGVRGEIASVRSIQWTTFLWLLALLIGTFGSLLGVVAKGFHWL